MKCCIWVVTVCRILVLGYLILKGVINDMVIRFTADGKHYITYESWHVIFNNVAF